MSKLELTPGTPQWFHKNFRKHFLMVGTARFIDTSILRAEKKCVLDVMAFDDYLHTCFGDYEDKGQSMRDVIVEKFSEEAAQFIEAAIGS